MEALLERGGRVHGASEGRPSSLHYLARFEDGELARAVCRSISDRKLFQQILEPKPSHGKVEGISVIECNVLSGRWRNILQMIQHLENIDMRQGESSLLYLALSRSPLAPLFIVEALLARGRPECRILSRSATALLDDWS